MADIVQRLTFPRPEPQNTGWLRSAGLPTTPLFAGAFAQQRTALLVEARPGRPIQYEIENQVTPITLPTTPLFSGAFVQQRTAALVGRSYERPIQYDPTDQDAPFYRLPKTPTFTGAMYPRKYDPWAAPKLNPVFDNTDQPGWIFKALPVAGVTVAQEAPAFAQQRSALLVGSGAWRDITLDDVVNPGALPFAGLATTPLFTGAFAQQRTALLVDRAPGRPIQFDSVVWPLPYYGLPTTPVFTAAFVRRYDAWAARGLDVTFDRTDQPGWLFAAQPQPGATVAQQQAAFMQQRTALLVSAAVGRDLTFEEMVNPGALPFAGLPSAVLIMSAIRRSQDPWAVPTVEPAYSRSTPYTAALTPALTTAQLMAAIYQQRTALLPWAAPGLDLAYEAMARSGALPFAGLPGVAILTAPFAQRRPDALIAMPVYRLDWTPVGGWITAALAPTLTVAQMLPAFQQHLGLLVERAPERLIQYDPGARWPVRYGLPITPVFTGAFAQSRGLLVDRRPGRAITFDRMVQLPPFVLPAFVPAGFIFISGESAIIPTASGEGFIVVMATGEIFFVPTAGGESSVTGSGG